MKKWLEAILGAPNSIPFTDWDGHKGQWNLQVLIYLALFEYFQRGLRDGDILCKAMRQIKPELIPRICTPKQGFQAKENVMYFLQAVQE